MNFIRAAKYCADNHLCRVIVLCSCIYYAGVDWDLFIVFVKSTKASKLAASCCHKGLSMAHTKVNSISAGPGIVLFHLNA